MNTTNDDDVSCSLRFVISPEISSLWTCILHRAGLKYVSNRQARVAGVRAKLRAAGATIYSNCVLYM